MTTTSYRVQRSLADRVCTRLVYAQQIPGLGHVIRVLLCVIGIDIPRSVRIGSGLNLMHATTGIVIYWNTVIGDNVTIFHGCTIGRGDPWRPGVDGPSQFFLEDDSILCAGAVVIANSGRVVTIGARSIVGANAVVRRSTNPGEVWAGNPAVCVGPRID